MKKTALRFPITVLTLFVALLWVTNSLSAQKTFTGTIKFKTTVEGTTDPNLISSVNKESETIFLGNKRKSVVNPQEGVSVMILSDADAQKVTVLYEITGLGKYYQTITKEDIDKGLKNIKYDVSYPGDKKTIAGHECKKVILATTDLETDEVTEHVLYVSEELNNSELYFEQYPGVKGVPLRVESPQDYEGSTITIIIEALSVTPSKKIKEVDFMLPSDAKDYKENPQMRMLIDGAEEED